MHRDIEAVRLQLEEVNKRKEMTLRTILSRPRPLAQQVTDLLDRAASAFETGDDHAVVELCDQILSLVPEQADAVELKKRTRARVRLRLIESTVEQARGALDRGELTAAGQLVKSIETDTQVASVRQFVDALQEARRVRRGATLVADARAALLEEAVERAIEHAHEALALDAENVDALDIARRAQRLLGERRRGQIDDALAQAESECAGGALEQAIQRLSEFAGEPDVEARLASVRRQLNERNARASALDNAVRGVEEFIAAGQFRQASDLLNDAAAIDAEDADVKALARWLQPIGAGLGQLDEAVRMLDENQVVDGGARLASAVAARGGPGAVPVARP